MPLNINFQQILLHLFNFALLFTILYLLLYSPVKKFMDKRTQYYAQMDQQARQNLEDSIRTREDYEQRLKRVEVESAEMRKKAGVEAQSLSDSVARQAKEEAAQIIAEARIQAQRERRRILSGAGDEISKMVTDATAKLVFADTDSAYEDFLNNVEGSGRREQ